MLSGRFVAAILLVSATAFAQHTSGVHSSGGSSHSSGSSSTVSHGSSGGSRATAVSSGHSSGGPVSHTVSAGPVSTHSNAQPVHFDREHTPVERPQKISGETVKPRSPASAEMPAKQEKKDPEKKGLRLFFRHPLRKRKPVETAEVKLPVPCKKQPCGVCPPGQNRHGTGACGAPAGVLAINRCGAGQFWDGAGCRGNVSECATYSSQADSLANELRGVRNEMDRACSDDRSGFQCLELAGQHDGQLLRYRGLLSEAPSHCRTLMPDPLSL